MSDRERVLVAKWGEVLHRALVEIRYLARQPGNESRIADLADLVHNIPHFMLGRHEHMHGYLRTDFVRYAETYRPGEPLESDRFLSVLDMSDQEFVVQFKRDSWHWTERAGQLPTAHATSTTGDQI